MVDPAGDLFIADAGNSVIREVDPAGTITTVVGDYDLGSGYSGDNGAAASAQLNDPTGVAVDAAGDLFIADSGNNVVRKVPPTLYWDPHQTDTENAGGGGAWTTDSADTYWYNPLLGADVAWSDGSDAVFSGTAATVTVSGPVSPASDHL